MQSNIARPTGPGAGVVKYDVLTALSVMALRSSQTVQTTVLRLIALITARYNWKRDYFSVPQTDMARMWNVSERTVKREIKRLIASGLVVCVRSGVRGRVAAYRLNYTRLSEQSQTCWQDVGTDFQTRMQSMSNEPASKIVRVDFASRNTHPKPPDLPVAQDLWGRVLHDLAESDPANLHNWYMKLSWVSATGGHIVLAAPSPFVAQFVQTHLVRALVPALARQTGHSVTLEITC